MSLRILTGAAELGLIYGLMALGVYITYRVLDFPDLSVDGSITLGAAVAAVLISRGYSPWVGLVLAPLVGALAGTIAGLLHTRLQIAPLLAGILTMTGLYSINLRIIGRANISLLGTATVADSLSALDLAPAYRWLVLSLLLVVLSVCWLTWLFQTEWGLALRATGDNATMAKSQGINVQVMQIAGLALGNALVALAGAAMAQLQGFADMGMGVGTIVSGLAAVIIGETLLRPRNIRRALLAVVAGSVVYRVIIAIALRLGLRTTDLRLVTAVLVVIALSLPQLSWQQKTIGQGR